MINLLNVDNFSKSKMPIKATEFFQKTGEFHPDGLFSEYIFGPVESKERKTKYSYIDLNTKVIHPTGLKLILQLNRNIIKLLNAEKTYTIDKQGNLLEDEYGNITGIKQFIKIFPKIKFRGDTDKREKFILKLKQSYNDNTLFIDKIPVIPPDYRNIYKDENDMWIYDELNDYYVNIIRKTFHMKGIDEGPLFDLLNYEVQKSVIDHDEFIRNKIQKKSGLIRSQLLGKRTDFSGRAVITPGPFLKSDEMGVPFRMAVVLFEPFIIHKILYTDYPFKNEIAKEIKKLLELDLSVDSLKNLFKYIKSGGKISDSLNKILFELCEMVSHDRVIISKRDPALHAESVRGYKPIIVNGNTMLLNTMSTSIHNADHDGDSIYSNIEYYIKRDNKLNKVFSHISKVPDHVNISLEKIETKINIVITKHKIEDEVYIDAIDPLTGKTDLKKVVNYSVHENLEMYKISDNKKRFKEFWSSTDHSLLVYNENNDEIEKISPIDLLKDSNGRYLIRKIK